VEPDVKGSVNVDLNGVPLDDALAAILGPLGYTFHHYGSVIVVGTPHAAPIAAAPPTPSVAPAVLDVTQIPVDRAATVLHDLYPSARISVDHSANALIVVAIDNDLTGMRTVLAGIDVPNPTQPQSEAIPLHTVDAHALAAKVGALYPNARVAAGPNKTLLVTASPQDMTQIKALVGAIDTPEGQATETAAPSQAIRVTQAKPQDVARAIAHEYPALKVAVSGASVLVSGPQDAIDAAKALVVLIDTPPASARYGVVYRLHNVDAQSVADLIERSYRDASVSVDEDLNAISVTAYASEQQRIADAVAQLDVAPGAGAPVAQPGEITNAGVGPGGSDIEVVTLKAAIPGQNESASTSATDLATAVTQALQQQAPDLRITVPNNSTQLVLTGSPYSLRLAKQLIDQLDVSPPLVVLDTEVLELDETTAKNLGLSFTQPLLSTTYSEIQPTSQPLLGIQPWERTPLSIPVALQTLVQNGTARVLADPRITTISGRTATIRAGDTISILTTVGGGAGTVATQQLQSFQTGVTLDITPVVNAGSSISVTLHPVVNSLEGLTNGIPQISTRDTQTTVNLDDDQTLVIGGLIQDSVTRSDTYLPVLGDIPLIGKIFHNQTLNHTRNELVIVVTPHLVKPGAPGYPGGPPLPPAPGAESLPTLPPGAAMPQGSHELPGSLPAQQPAQRATPLPTPTAFANTNTFVYGQAPANNYAGPGDAAQIFYASLTPTVVSANTLVTVNAITTTNVARVVISTGFSTTQIGQIAPGKWQSRFTFNVAGLPVGQSTIQLTLVAFKSDGSSATIGIPISVGP
ncbi:MAG TPA: secretin N-terminal domain-containing protein, partial [Candidatus Eremiobacteraceae bacterium]|nr:secretin N-terminal domain-containing protein [Candidatus Eremiobacteraceae bacterium]